MVPPVLLSTRPGQFDFAARIEAAVEIKLDWDDVDQFGQNYTLTDACRDGGLDPKAIGSVHLPPGTVDPRGMAAARENVGTITEFVHSAFGEAVVPNWLTLHSDRHFDYQAHLELLETITAVTEMPIALENTPDASDLHTPEDMAMLAFLGAETDRLQRTELLVDTAHVPPDRHDPAVDQTAMQAVLDRLDPNVRDRIEEPFRQYCSPRDLGVDAVLDPRDPWWQALTTFTIVGPERIRAIHLNDPETDGTPVIEHAVPEGLAAVVDVCRTHDIAIVLEPGKTEMDDVVGTLDWLEEMLDRS